MKKMKEERMTMKDLFIAMGHHPDEMYDDVPVEVYGEGWEIQSYDTTNDMNVWAPITRIVKKPMTSAYRVDDLYVTPEHKFWATVDDYVAWWWSAEDLAGKEEVWLFHQDEGWILKEVIKTDEVIDVLDVEVDGTSSYFSNGFLSHNTLYGDPDTTPGGEMSCLPCMSV
jgi:hypothetical protein